MVAKLDYNQSLKEFDRKYSKLKRQFYISEQEQIARIETSNPKEFWKKIKALGPKRKANLILEVNTNSGVSGNVDIVLKTWRNQFENLYNANSNTKSNNCSLTNDIQLFLSYLERNDYYISENDTTLLNKPISEAEVIFSIVNAKRNKAVGIDNLPYEVFKTVYHIN